MEVAPDRSAKPADGTGDGADARTPVSAEVAVPAGPADNDRPKKLPSIVGPPAPPPAPPAPPPKTETPKTKTPATENPFADDTTPGRRRASVWPALMSIVLPMLLVGGAGWALWQARVPVVQWAAPKLASLADTDVALTIRRIDETTISAANVSVGSVEADEVTATYDLSSLLRRQFDSLNVSGLRLQATVSDDGVTIAGLPTPDRADGNGLAALPFETMSLDDAVVVLGTPNGSVELAGDGTMQAGGDGVVALRWRGTADGGALGGGAFSVSGDISETADGVQASLVFEGEGAAGDGLAAVLGSRAGQTLAGAKAGGIGEVTVALGGETTAQFALSDGWLNLPERSFAISRVMASGDVRLAANGLPEGSLSIDHGGIVLGNLAVGPGPVALRHEGGTATVEGILDLPMGKINAQFSGAPGAPDAVATFSLVADLDATAAAAHVDGLAATGRLGLALSGHGENLQSIGRTLAAAGPPGDMAGWLHLLDEINPRLTGSLDADLAGVTAVGLFSGGTLTGPLTVQLSPDGLQLAGDGPVQAGVSRLTFDGADVLQASLPAAVLLGGAAGTPLRLDVRRDGDGFDVVATVGLVTDGLPVTVQAEVDGTVRLNLDGVPQRIDVPFILAQIGGLAAPGGQVDADVLVSDLAGPMDDLAGDVSVGLAAPLLALNGATLTGVSGEIDGGIAWDGALLAVSPTAGSRVTVGRVSTAGGVGADEPVTLTLAPGRHTVRLEPGAAPEIDVTLADSPALTIRQGGRPVAAVDLDEVRVRSSDGSLTAAFDGASVGLTEQPVSLRGISGVAGFTAGAGPTANVTIETIRHASNAVVPLTAEVTVAPADDGRLSILGTARDKAGWLKATLAGGHDMASGRGSGVVSLAPLAFLPTVLQPVDLFPALAGGPVDEVDGMVQFDGTLNWGDGAATLPGLLTFDLAAMQVGEMAIETAAGAIRFADLISQRTEPNQEVKVGLVDVGIPLTDGRIVFDLPGDGSINAQLRELDMFGGLLNSDPFTIPAAPRDFDAVLRVNGVELAQMLAATKQVGELEMSGTLDGEIPVRFENGEVAIHDGQLNTGTTGGILHYAPGEVGPALSDGEFSTGLFLDAVDNFHYDSITVTLDEGEAEDMVVGLFLRGRNPDLYGGAPLELNINLEGPLRDILSRGVNTYRLPDRIRDELSRDLGVDSAILGLGGGS